MGRKKNKKYQQTIASPYFEPAPGSQLLRGLGGLLSKLFGPSTSEPTTQQLIDYHLTAREREIVYLAVLGFTDKEIADALVMNFKTVRVHLRNILNKLQVNDVGELSQYFTPRDLK